MMHSQTMPLLRGHTLSGTSPLCCAEPVAQSGELPNIWNVRINARGARHRSIQAAAIIIISTSSKYNGQGYAVYVLPNPNAARPLRYVIELRSAGKCASA